MTSATTLKSGTGTNDRVISELATYWDVLPGHADELHAATSGSPTCCASSPVT